MCLSIIYFPKTYLFYPKHQQFICVCLTPVFDGNTRFMIQIQSKEKMLTKKLFIQGELVFIYCACVFLDISFAAFQIAHEIVVERAAYSYGNFTSPVKSFHNNYQHFFLEIYFISYIYQLHLTIDTVSKSLKTIVFFIILIRNCYKSCI